MIISYKHFVIQQHHSEIFKTASILGLVGTGVQLIWLKELSLDEQELPYKWWAVSLGHVYACISDYFKLPHGIMINYRPVNFQQHGA